MKTDIYDIKGKVVGKMDLDPDVFGVEPNKEILLQYLRVFRANQEQGTSSTKTRGEVSGGGRKPWKQKRTGRARHGSIRSPIWRKGGISHGPRPKSVRLSLPKKMKRLAIVSALSAKNKSAKIKILDKLELKEPKTKKMVELLNNLNISSRSLLVVDKKSDNIFKSSRNIKLLDVVVSDYLNGYELIRSDNVIFVKDAVAKIQEKYKKK